MDVGMVFNYINFAGACLAAILYFRNAARCAYPHWKIYKYMLGSSMTIMAGIYMMFILEMNVHFLAARLNTSFYIGLMIANATLGRSKYGIRS